MNNEDENKLLDLNYKLSFSTFLNNLLNNKETLTEKKSSNKCNIQIRKLSEIFRFNKHKGFKGKNLSLKKEITNLKKSMLINNNENNINLEAITPRKILKNTNIFKNDFTHTKKMNKRKIFNFKNINPNFENFNLNNNNNNNNFSTCSNFIDNFEFICSNKYFNLSYKIEEDYFYNDIVNNYVLIIDIKNISNYILAIEKLKLYNKSLKLTDINDNFNRRLNPDSFLNFRFSIEFKNFCINDIIFQIKFNVLNSFTCQNPEIKTFKTYIPLNIFNFIEAVKPNEDILENYIKNLNYRNTSIKISKNILNLKNFWNNKIKIYQRNSTSIIFLIKFKIKIFPIEICLISQILNIYTLRGKHTQSYILNLWKSLKENIY